MLIEGDIEALKEVPGTLGHIGGRESQYSGYIIGLKTSTQSQWERGRGGRMVTLVLFTCADGGHHCMVVLRAIFG